MPGCGQGDAGQWAKQGPGRDPESDQARSNAPPAPTPRVWARLQAAGGGLLQGPGLGARFGEGAASSSPCTFTDQVPGGVTDVEGGRCRDALKGQAGGAEGLGLRMGTFHSGSQSSGWTGAGWGTPPSCRLLQRKDPTEAPADSGPEPGCGSARRTVALGGLPHCSASEITQCPLPSAVRTEGGGGWEEPSPIPSTERTLRMLATS